MGDDLQPSFGIEEEYHLAHVETGELTAAPPELIAACEQVRPGQISPEFLQSQIEVGTRPHTSFADAHAELAELRTRIADEARRFDLAPVAAGTHPMAQRTRAVPTSHPRYDALAEDLAGVGRRLVVCGMHVHVGLSDEDLRIDVMNQVRYFIPHLMVLCVSSPFWERELTGLKSFRSVIMDSLPRTGLPNRFESWAEYERTISVLIRNGVIEDATKIWWDLRPSARHPTLELRPLDVCTDLKDAVAVSALFVCLCRMLVRLRRANQSWRPYPAVLINENRWRARRYGTAATLFDFGRGTLVDYPSLLEEMLELVAEDADALGAGARIAHTRTIVSRGTSADLQERLHAATLAATGSPVDAQRAVTRDLMARTIDSARTAAI